MVVYMWALPVSTLTFNELAADTLRWNFTYKLGIYI
jgi:hypothetical protein